jgi:hypothetical protein
MLKNEKALWATMKRHTEGRVFWTRIENLAVPGIPDLHGVCRGEEAHVELKVAKDDWHISFEPSQLAWYARYLAHRGRRTFILVYQPNCMAIYRPEVFLHPTGQTAVKRRERVIVLPSGRPVFSFPASMGVKVWDAVVDSLFDQVSKPLNQMD